MTRLSIDSARTALTHTARLARAETIASIAVPAPVVSAADVARTFGDELRFLWRDDRGRLFGSAGVTDEVRAEGRERFAIAREGVRELYRRVAGTKRPVFGGFAFVPGATDSGEWRGFGDGRLELPKIAYNRRDGRAELVVAVKNPLDAAVRRRALEELERWSQGLERALASPIAASGADAVLAKPPARDLADYLALVADARDRVRAREFEKLVVARGRSFDVAGGIELPALIARLDHAYPDCTILAVRGEDSLLVAATPERLAAVEGGQLKTAALAGTVPSEAAADLFSDEKLQTEHRLTAEAIASALRAARGVTGVEAGTAVLRRLRNLVHLETPIRADLDGGVHLFDIAEALHPTPAVAGIPTDAACRFLAEREGLARGWYSGLVGFCDHLGGGDLAVALRAGLIGDGSIRLFAGAGIVADSVPETEWAETELKLAALAALIGGHTT